MEYYQGTIGVLSGRCQGTVRVLSGHCQGIVRVLSGSFQGTVHGYITRVMFKLFRGQVIGGKFKIRFRAL